MSLSHLYQFTVSSLHLHTLYPSKFNTFASQKLSITFPESSIRKERLTKSFTIGRIDRTRRAITIVRNGG